MKGRSLNLKEGKLESTESIYKHHMQVESELILSLINELKYFSRFISRTDRNYKYFIVALISFASKFFS